MRLSRTEVVMTVIVALAVFAGLGGWIKHDLETDGIGSELPGLIGATESRLVETIGTPVERVTYAQLRARGFKVRDMYSKAQDVPSDECLVYRRKFYAYVVYLKSGKVVGSCRIGT